MDQNSSIRSLVENLCSDACAGRRAGSPGGLRARGLVVDALRSAGLDPWEQPAPGCGGANVVATIPGAIDRWVLVGAHYDHLGRVGREIYRGADDNAASVAVMAQVARAIASHRPDGRGVMFVAFDGEEPPFYATGDMGSQTFVDNPPVPLDRIDMMVAMELLGHRIGPLGLPDEVGASVFALGGERSAGTSRRIDALATREAGVVVRRADADVIPPLSDHLAFWEAGVPFVFLTGTRSATYHTTDDTPEHLDWDRLDAVAGWLEAFVRDQCSRPEGRVEFRRGGRDDRSTIDTVEALVTPLASLTPMAGIVLQRLAQLRARCDDEGRLGDRERAALAELVGTVEAALA